MAAIGFDVLAREEPIEELDRLEHHVDALGRLGPVLRDDVLVERLATAQAQPEPAGIHRGEGRRGLRDYDGMRPERRARNPWSDITLGALGDRGHESPHERGLALLRHPR